MKEFIPPKEIFGFPVFVIPDTKKNEGSILFGDFHEAYGVKKIKIEKSK